MSKPFFSIVVVCLNVEDTIRETINSILNQDFEDYEIVVKDGLSTDNTISMIPKSDKIRLFEEKDSGIYDAMNQGIKHSDGEYICFLNCGDLFENKSVLREIYNCAKDEQDIGVIYGNYMRNGVVFKQPSSISPFYLYRTPLCHQTMFISKKMFEENGLYDCSYKILADYEHTLHDYTSGKKFKYCNIVVCNYLGGGASESEKGKKIKAEERKKIVKEYFSKADIKKYEFKLFMSMKKLRQYMISDKSPEFVRKLYRWLVNIVNR